MGRTTIMSKLRKFHTQTCFFLECTMGDKPLPSECASLCALISLADQFMCPSLQLRLNDHLGTEEMFLNLSLSTKSALIRAADKHKGDCVPLLETCIRLCANLSFMDVFELNGQISDGAMLAVYAMISNATKQIELDSAERSLTGVEASGDTVLSMMGVRTKVILKQVDAWECSTCKGTKIKETLTYGKVKQFQIDQNKLKE